MKAIDDFVAAMHELFAQPLDDAQRWERVGGLMPLLLDDAELRASAATWPTTQYGNAATNLLFYEDPDHKFVINGLVKDPHAATPVHDHAHTWTAYGVIEGRETVVRYAITAGERTGDRVALEPATEYVVAPGYVGVVPPHEPHAETAGDYRTIAVIVRSERIGSFPQNMYDPQTGRIDRRTHGDSAPAVGDDSQPRGVGRLVRRKLASHGRTGIVYRAKCVVASLLGADDDGCEDGMVTVKSQLGVRSLPYQSSSNLTGKVVVVLLHFPTLAVSGLSVNASRVTALTWYGNQPTLEGHLRTFAVQPEFGLHVPVFL